MELLVLLGLSLAIGTAVILDDDDGDEDQDTGAAINPDDGENTSRGSSSTTTGGADDFTGTNQNETIFAHGGDDVVEGRGGDDRIFGMDGEDILVGGSGNDFLRGGAGNDNLIDNEGSDTIHGDTGDDRIIVTSGIDGEGIIGFARGVANGTITDFDEADRFVNPDTDSDDNADSVIAGIGNDTVIAGDGDIVSLGKGNDTMVLGDWVDANDDPVTVTDFDPGEDVLVYSYDGNGLPPQLSVQRVGDGTGDEGQGSALVFADNVFVARIPGAGGLLSVSDISIATRSPGGPSLP